MSRSMLDKRTDLVVSEGDDGTILVEAPNAEVALEEVTRRLGAGAQILKASKVTRGGVGGFFARELVQLRAQGRAAATADTSGAADAAPAAPAGTAATGATGATAEAAPAPAGGLDALLASLAADTDRQERSFAEVLRERLPEMSAGVSDASGPAADAPAAAPADTSVTPASAPAPALRPGPATAPGDDAALAGLLAGPRAGDAALDRRHGPDWSARNLQILGMPQIVVDAVRGCDPADDLGCLTAVARAVDSLCRPLPAGACVYVGPRARRTATATGVPVVKVGEAVPGGAVALVSRGGARARTWLRWNRQRRWLHVIAGGEGWRELLFDEPLAVSWATAHDLSDAVRVAAELGLVLGSGPLPSAPDAVSRANPVDVAYAVRALLPQR